MPTLRATASPTIDVPSPAGAWDPDSGWKVPADLPLDHRIAWVADRQGGVVDLEQLEILGLSATAARDRAAAGRLHRRGVGIYAPGRSRLGPRGHEFAALLAGGPGAVLAVRSAAAAHELRQWSGKPQVIVPTTNGRRRRQEVSIKRRRLEPSDVVILDDRPVTSLSRTVLDLSEVLQDADVQLTLTRAEQRRRLDLVGLRDVIGRTPTHRGRRRLEAVLAELHPEALRVRSRDELVAYELLREVLDEPPLVNRTVEGFEVDLHWPHLRLIVEIDAHPAHRTTAGRRADARRDALLRAAGWVVLRQVTVDVEAVRRAALAQSVA